MDERQLEQEYQNWKRQSAPDLWDRIEGRLNDYPERGQGENSLYTAKNTVNSKGSLKHWQKIRKIYGAAAGIAAAVCLAVSVPELYRVFAVRQENKTAEETLPNRETTEGTELSLNRETAKGTELSPLSVPENALTVPADSAYFSQTVLADTELLCSGTVKEVSLEDDGQGRMVKIVYQLSINQLYYTQDYLDKTEQITVKSPIVKADSDTVGLLYQMKKDNTYLLPLKKQEGSWELIYPFAPQIQQTGAHSYVFHSGYRSLINENTQVVKGEQEGENDYFYDRMLLREDEDFTADLLRLVEEQANGISMPE